MGNQDTRTTKLTDDQRHLIECMDSLFDICNDEEFSKTADDLSLKRLTRKLNKFFRIVFRSKCYFHRTKGKYTVEDSVGYEYVNGFKKYNLGNSIEVDLSQLYIFVDLMKTLRDDIINNNFNHFILNCELNLVQNIPAKKEETTGSYIGMIDGGTKNEHDYPINLKFSDKVNWTDIRHLFNKIEKVTRKVGGRCSYIDHNVVIFSTSLKTFEVDPLTIFAKNILLVAPEEEEIDSVQSLKLKSSLSFLEIVKSVFVNFHVCHDNFERIKICEYSECNKLLLEKKKGSLSFCDDRCRKKCWIENFPVEKRRCRDRQTQWIRYQTDKVNIRKKGTGDIRSFSPASVPISGCRRCGNVHESGACPILIKMNKDVIALL